MPSGQSVACVFLCGIFQQFCCLRCARVAINANDLLSSSKRETLGWERSTCKALGLLYGTLNLRNGHCDPLVAMLKKHKWKPPGTWFRGRSSPDLDPLMNKLISNVKCTEDEPCPALETRAHEIIQMSVALAAKHPKYQPALQFVIEKTQSWMKKMAQARATERPPTFKNAQNATREQLVDHLVALTTFLDKHPEEFNKYSFDVKASRYALIGHELNSALIKNEMSISVLSEDSGATEILYLGEFFPSLVKAMHPLPPFQGRVYRNGFGFLPFTVPELKEEEVGRTFRVHQFLSTAKVEPRSPSTFNKPIAIDAEPNGWFRDISANSADEGMNEVLGIMGMQLKYVSAPSEELPYYHFVEV